ncbi:MAG: AMP-binding protein [Candidatus Acetothermia bacterium]|jgi:acetyl-CoA synthetase|nr:AMP-binding protein [Candidatus Acetothermia bacterium]
MVFTREQYERERREFRWNIPDGYNIAAVVDAHARARPDRACILWESESGEKRALTWRQLSDLSSRFAAVLMRLGVRKGDPVLHIFPRLPEAFIAQIGTFKAGGVAVPCTEMVRAKDIVYRAETAGARVVVAHTITFDEVEAARGQCPLEHFILIGGERDGWLQFEKEVERAPAVPPVPTSAHDPMTINFTSGTTGNPKPVMHRHRWMYGHSRVTARYWWDASPDDLIWATTAPGWAKWYWSPLGVGLTTGATQFVYHGKFDAERYLELLTRYPITKLCATPTEYRMIVQVPNLSRYKISLKDALSAGEPLNVEPIEVFRDAFGVTIRDGYGQTESVCLVCNYPGLPVKPGSMGVPTPGPGATPVDEEGQPVGPGEVGEIAVPVGSPGIFDGYWRDPDLTRQVFSGKWYRTGDLVRVDEEGYFFFEGRADDVIKASGYRIGPFEVEDALVSHPAVVEAAVIGAPHPVRGQIVKAFVVLARGYQPSEALVQELQDHVKQVTAPYKYPREIEFVTDLPKTPSGKIKRAELRKRELEHHGGGT